MSLGSNLLKERLVNESFSYFYAGGLESIFDECPVLLLVQDIPIRGIVYPTSITSDAESLPANHRGGGV